MYQSGGLQRPSSGRGEPLLAKEKPAGFTRTRAAARPVAKIAQVPRTRPRRPGVDLPEVGEHHEGRFGVYMRCCGGGVGGGG